jgi:hypothetical protein
MEHLALNVYRWSEAAQDRAATRCLAPAIRELRGAGAVRRFFFSRFDARGPHLAAYLGVAPGRGAEVEDALSAALARHLAAEPCTASLADGELATLHDACRGAELSPIDAEPGFAANDSFRIAPQATDAPLLGLTRAAAGEGEIWELLTELALWSIARVEAGQGAAAAAQWVASADLALHRAGAPAYAWWRWYTSTLLMGLEDRVAGDDDAFLRRIPRVLGEKNLAAVQRAWSAADASPVRWPGVDRLFELVAADDGRGDFERRHLFRLVNHSTLAQLGSPVRLRIPLVLYAWYRARPAAAVPA